MADIFNEVDEELQRERLQKLWQRYQLPIVVVAVLIVAGVAGWRGYEYYETQKATAAGADFERAATLADDGKHAEAGAAFGKVVKEAPKGYAMLARFREANELAQTKPAEAVKSYDALAADGSLEQAWRDLASLRAGMLLVDSAPYADMEKRLKPISGAGGTYRHSARELLALSAWRNKDLAAAKTYIDIIAADGETPPGVRQRIEVLSALMAGNGKS